MGRLIQFNAHVSFLQEENFDKFFEKEEITELYSSPSGKKNHHKDGFFICIKLNTQCSLEAQ
jgi:hypothetical protein